MGEEIRKLVVIGASAGGLPGFKAILEALPHDFPAAICIVQHLPLGRRSALAAVLQRGCHLPVVDATDGQKLRLGHVYIGREGHHLLVEGGCLRVTLGPRINGYRPSIDNLFVTAANSYGNQTIGVILSGMLDDGSMGAASIKRRGGMVIVQDPADAEHADMPIRALEAAQADYCVDGPLIGPLLARLVQDDITEGRTMVEEIAAQAPSEFACPECGGTMFQKTQNGLRYYKCHTGHQFSPDSLFASHSEMTERALWSALRALKEKSALMEKVLFRHERGAPPQTAELMRERFVEINNHIQLLGSILNGEYPREADTLRPPGDPNGDIFRTSSSSQGE